MAVALVLTGAPGAGKSSVLEALTTRLEMEGVGFSALESEQLARGHPWLSAPEYLPQLAAVMALQRDVGRTLFLVTATTETAAELRGVVAAIDAERTIVVLLVAHPDLVAARIEAREPDRWPGKTRLIAHARALAVSMPAGLDAADARISTDAGTADDAAARVRHLLATVGR